jgi:hypothetical protein
MDDHGEARDRSNLDSSFDLAINVRGFLVRRGRTDNPIIDNARVRAIREILESSDSRLERSILSDFGGEACLPFVRYDVRLS